MAENAQRGATYEMEARTLVGGSGAPVQTDVHLSLVSQVSNVYLSPAFQYRVTSTGAYRRHAFGWRSPRGGPREALAVEAPHREAGRLHRRR